MDHIYDNADVNSWYS